MKNIIYSIAFALLCVMLGLNQALAQANIESNSLYYHSIRMPQNNAFNPALYPANNNFYFTLPRAEVSLNSPLSLRNILTHNPGDNVTYIDVNNVLDQLNENNRFRVGAEVDVLGFGIKFRHTFITFSSKVKAHSSVGLPIEAFNFITQGNLDENGNPISQIDVVNGNLMNLQAYGEIGIGVGHEFKNLTLGFKAKMLLGIINATTTDTYVKLNTSETMDELNASASYKVKIASIFDWENPTGSIQDINPIVPNTFGGYIPHSTGFAFDLGAKYQFGPLSVSASILDMSRGIHWNQNVYDVTPQGEGAFHFDGLNINGNDLINDETITFDTLSDYFKQQLDSLNPQFTESAGYWHGVPTHINVGASYEFLNSFFKVGVLWHGQFDHGLMTCKKAIDHGTQTFRHNTTISLSMNLADWLELTIASGITNDSKKVSFFNPGLSLTFSPFTILQIYAAIDYVSSIYTVDMKRLNAMAGVNIMIGHGKTKKR